MTLLGTLQEDLRVAGDRLAQRQVHRRRRRRLLAFAAGGTLLLSGGAVAGTTILRPLDPQPVDPHARVVPAPGPGNHGAPHQTSADALRAHLAPSLRDVDWDAAKSFAIPGTDLRGWTFDQPGKRCLALPDPLSESYGVICRTPEEIAAGEAKIKIITPPGFTTPTIAGGLLSPGDDPPRGRLRWVRIGDVYVGAGQP